MKYILSALQNDKRSGTVIDFEQMTIEHLVPQSQIGSEIGELVIGQLGNLIVVSQDMNSRLRNRSFREKKQILVAEGFRLPAEIAAADDWGEQNIRNRTNLNAVRAYEKLWRI